MDDASELRSAELEMLAAAAEAAKAAWKAIGAMRRADRALDRLDAPSWGPVVAEWHQAADGLNEALETVQAYREFEPSPWWGTWR